ncbi:MAG: TetR family transcriptional regulator [Solirubrobacterales bacterium]|nr:TetR family transcriptional regulator [Solirubrobacterales bacterium]
MAILDAAERLFAERGFDGASLGDIGAAAAVSRATPSYFFGGKEQLYAAVLERVFAEREAATAEAFAPLHAWAAGGPGTLERALTRAIDGYLGFLLARPAFVALVAREGVEGGARLRAAPRASSAMADAFAALRAAGPRRGVRRFDVADAVLLTISLTFSPLTQRGTFLAALGRDLDDPATRRRHVRLAARQLLHLVEAP